MGRELRRLAAAAQAPAVDRFESFEAKEGFAGEHSGIATEYVTATSVDCSAAVQFQLIY
jgi:hypothetical protein